MDRLVTVDFEKSDDMALINSTFPRQIETLAIGVLGINPFYIKQQSEHLFSQSSKPGQLLRSDFSTVDEPLQ